MLNRDEALNLVGLALQHSQADQTEITLTSTDHGLTRLANGGIHQHVSTVNVEVRVRAVLGKRIGVAVSNRVGGDALRELVDRAIAIARVSEPNPKFVSLPAPESVDEETRGLAGPVPTPMPDMGEPFTPERRADAAVTLVHTAVGNGVTVAGHVSTSVTALAVGNSLGIRAYHACPECGVMAIMTKGDASGYADWTGTSLAEAPVETIAGQAGGKCLAALEPRSVDPGAYTVILEPPAVAEMLAMLAYVGLGANAFLEGRSFMSGRIGEQLTGSNITLRDDTYHPGMPTLPFDYEGSPRRVVPFFTHGVARGVVHDSFTAHEAKTTTTGHALPAPNPSGPLPMHLVLEAGGETRERLMRDVQRGILVTRFHYVNIVHPKETTLTGMTRDGTFLIENGSVTHAVKNLRFTQSILEALSRVSGIENMLTLVNQEGFYCQVPTLRIDGFHFTS